jgi:hypothetical protein
MAGQPPSGHGDLSSHTCVGGQGRETDPVLGNRRSGPCDRPTWLLVSNRTESASAGLSIGLTRPPLPLGKVDLPFEEETLAPAGMSWSAGKFVRFLERNTSNRRPQSQRFATNEMRRKT